MYSQTGRARLENRIFGNGILPEDCLDQIFPGFAFAAGIGLGHEASIRRIEMIACRRFRLNPPLREHNQRPAHRKMLFPGHAPYLNCQLRRNGDALPDGCCRSRACL